MDKDNLTDMSQIADCQYICKAINEKWKTNFSPESGTASKAANCEYLLKMVDKANKNTTYGSSSYATKQVIDTAAVTATVENLWKPAGKFVAVANSDKAAHSTDGITWTAATMSDGNWRSVTYGNGKFVAVAYSKKAAYSTDGITWTATTMPGNVQWCSVTCGGED